MDDEKPDYVCANLRGYLSIPGSYVVELIPGYFPDPSSDDWGVVIAWDNPVPRILRHFPWLKGLVANRIRAAVSAEWEARKQHVRQLARARASYTNSGCFARAHSHNRSPEPRLARVG